MTTVTNSTGSKAVNISIEPPAEQVDALRNFDKPKHTPEPWVILSGLTTNEDAPVQVGRDDVNPHERIIAAQINAYSFWGMTVETANANANATRIVLCVNKCAGITNEELEALPPVKELSKRLETALDYNQALKNGNLALVTKLEDATHRHAKQCERLNVVRDTRNGLEAELKRLKSRNLWQRIFNL